MTTHGFRPTAPPTHAGGALSSWEALVADAVGTVIAFWGFKHNQGRLWALLYLRGRAMTAGELQDALGLSKGAVSILTRELTAWGVVHKVKGPGRAHYSYCCETDLMAMISRVIRAREAGMLARVRADLDEAYAEARRDARISPAGLERLKRLRTLATMVERAVFTFSRSARMDVGQALSMLRDDADRPRGDGSSG